MKPKRKICVITATRAEYGLLYWLIKAINESNDLELQIIATGMHLSPEFGLTYKQIEVDGFFINKKIEMLLSSDTRIGNSKSMALAQIGFAETYDELKPDLIIILGDRFEMLSAATAATIARIPIAHLHGGEITEGAFDDCFRHAITKMSHLHFTSTESYRQRVIQLGEEPDRVFNVGALGIDSIFNLSLLSKNQFEEAIQFTLGKKNLLVTFHPVTLEMEAAKQQFSNILQALDLLHNTKIIFTKANADTGGRIINQMIDEYVAANPSNTIAFTSMGQKLYLSALQFMDGVLGNSSSGIIEAPSFKIGTINIGDRQKGRIKASSIIDCLPKIDEISKAIDLLFSEHFKLVLTKIENPNGDGKASEKIFELVKKHQFQSVGRKTFHDLKMR
jgi:GDP/UDP-N,N'-diacetylbacillosamine 2-epimerase (hydrolysing)